MIALIDYLRLLVLRSKSRVAIVAFVAGGAFLTLTIVLLLAWHDHRQVNQTTVERFLRIRSAFFAFVEENGRPPENIYISKHGDSDENAIPALSWRVMLLPYLGYRSGASISESEPAVEFTKCWNDDANRAVDASISDSLPYLEPAADRETMIFSLRTLDNKNLAWEAEVLNDPDRILLICSHRCGVDWMEPGDYVVTSADLRPSVTGAIALGQLKSEQRILLLFADGSVWAVEGADQCEILLDRIDESGKIYDHDRELNNVFRRVL